VQKRVVVDQNALAWVEALHSPDDHVAAERHLRKAPTELFFVLAVGKRMAKCRTERADSAC
jgi:hypothetical protein